VRITGNTYTLINNTVDAPTIPFSAHRGPFAIFDWRHFAILRPRYESPERGSINAFPQGKGRAHMLVKVIE
jgi:hypothetical protein